jgi:hypothetical protein
MPKKQPVYLVREDRVMIPCWEIRKCPVERRENCVVYEYEAGYYCWYMSGTLCQGTVHKTWEEKMEICRECEVYKPMLCDQ